MLKDRPVCANCYTRRLSPPCVRCGIRNRFRSRISPVTGLCPRCAAHPEAICAGCSLLKIIFNVEAGLCKSCHQKQLQRQALQSYRARKRSKKVTCTVCGKRCFSITARQAICRRCWREAHYERKLCQGCQRLKLIPDQKRSLCAECVEHRHAPERLKRFLADYSTAYPYNRLLFELLASNIDWKALTHERYNRYRRLGIFLQEHQLREPLTWETIYALLADLKPTRNPIIQDIREALLELGDLLSASSKLESRSSYLAKRHALLPINNAPAPFQPVLHRYASYLLSRRGITTGASHEILDVLVGFYNWCQARGIQSPFMVTRSLIGEYFVTLRWQWECRDCHGKMALDLSVSQPPGYCVHCGAMETLIKVRRYAQSTIYNHWVYLRRFFSWAKANRLVFANPVHELREKRLQTIKQYPPEVIKQLIDYVAAPDADPIEAMALYLILFHAFSIWELRHALMPDLSLTDGHIQRAPLREVYYIRLPKRFPSKRSRLYKRPRRWLGAVTRIDFPSNAAPWLKPLLERFDQVRQRRVKHLKLKSPYLFVALQGRTRTAVPISKTLIDDIVRRASFRVLHAACAPNRLRETVGAQYTDLLGPQTLRDLGWGASRAFSYKSLEREIIHPQPRKNA